MRRGLTSLLCVLAASTTLLSPAVAEQLAEKPLPAPARPRADRTAALEQRVRDLEARLVAVEAELRRLQQRPTPPPVPLRSFGPDASKTYAIPLDDSPAIGPRVAPVTMVAVVQFPEPFTLRVWPTLQQLRTEYKHQRRTVFKVFVVHPRAERSSIAVCAAGPQGQLDRMADAVTAAASITDDGSKDSPTRELPANSARSRASCASTSRSTTATSSPARPAWSATRSGSRPSASAASRGSGSTAGTWKARSRSRTSARCSMRSSRRPGSIRPRAASSATTTSA